MRSQCTPLPVSCSSTTNRPDRWGSANRRPRYPILRLVACAISLAGCAEDRARRLDEADQAYSLRAGDETLAALARLPDDAEALWRIARIEVWLGRPENGRAAAERAVALDPRSGEALLWAGYAGALAIAARPVGERLIEAPLVESRLRAALEVDPSAARAHVGLAILALALAQEPADFPRDLPDPALHLRVARELRPGLTEPHLLLARIHLARGDPEAAARDLEPLLGDAPEAMDGPNWPDAQVSEWAAASRQARALRAALFRLPE